MTASRDLLRLFEAGNVAALHGLPPGLGLAEVGAIVALDETVREVGVLGEQRRPAEWVAAESDTYEGGVRVWHESGSVLVLEGRDPVDAAGTPLAAPALEEPEAALDSVLGRLSLPGGERIYAARGLALRVNPENELLLGVLVFSPVAAGEYVARLRPELPRQRLLAGSGSLR